MMAFVLGTKDPIRSPLAFVNATKSANANIDSGDKLILIRRIGGTAWRHLTADIKVWLKEHSV